MELVTPSIGLIFWTTLAFVTLLFLLRKFAWAPILKAVNDREETISNAMNAAEEAKKEMANLTASNERLLIANAKATIEMERKSAIADLKNQVAALSIDIAEKVVKGTLTGDDKQKALVNELVEEVNLN